MDSSIPSRPVRIGVIGAGSRLRGVLLEVLKNATDGELRVISVYDPNPDSCATLREKLGYDIEIAQSEESVAQNPDVDWVFIGSWNCFHARQAIAALNAGKNVFCEKPLATTFEDCVGIRDAARQSGRIFAFGLVLRYASHYQEMRRIIESGVLGKIMSFEFNETLGFNHGGYIMGDWRRLQSQAGSHVLEKCCHDLDLANWLINSVPVRVASFGGRNFFVPENAGRIEELGANEDGDPPYRGWISASEHLNPFTSGADICDNQVAILEYENGVRGTFHTNCNAGIPERRMYILGSHGAMRADLDTGKIEIRKIGWKTEIQTIDSGADGGHGGGDKIMAKALVRTLCCGEPPLASVAEGVCSAVVAFGIDRALAESEVVDLRPMWAKAGIDPATIMESQS